MRVLLQKFDDLKMESLNVGNRCEFYNNLSFLLKVERWVTRNNLLGCDAVGERAVDRVARDVRHQETGEAVDRTREESHERRLHRAVCTHIASD